MTQPVGIVLAGGKAERLPNKPLLPCRPDGLPLVVDAVLRLFESGRCSDVLVVENGVCRPSTVARTVLPSYRSRILSVLDTQSGIPAALARTAIHPTARVTVVPCDNVFSQDEDLSWKRRGLTVRKPGPAVLLHRQLDWHDGIGWRSREDLPHTASDLCDVYALSSPWFLKGSDLGHCVGHRSVLQWLNAIQVPAIEADAAGWADLGTPEAYSQHWRTA